VVLAAESVSCERVKGFAEADLCLACANQCAGSALYGKVDD